MWEYFGNVSKRGVAQFKGIGLTFVEELKFIESNISILSGG